MSSGDCKVYKKRWYMLGVVTALSISNAQLWSSFASVPNVAAKYFKVSETEIGMLSMVYFLCCFPAGIFPLWFVDYVGLKRGIWLGAWLNAVGASIRLLSTTQFVENNMRYGIMVVGQVIAGSAQMFLYVPTKVTELWFPPNERTFATSLVAMANPLGIMIGIGIGPLLILNAQDIPWLNFGSCLYALLCVLLTCGITSSKPPIPPSESAIIEDVLPFKFALKELVTNKSYLLLLLFSGTYIGVFEIFISYLTEIVTPQGYTNKFSALCLVLMISFGVIGSIISGVIIDKTKLFTVFAKIFSGCFCTLFIILSVILGYPNMEYPILITSVLFGMAVFMAYTVTLELTVECTFPVVPEATSSGILFINAQLFGIIYSLIVMFASKIITKSGGTGDPRTSLFIIAVIVVIINVIFVIFFKTEYKRLKSETSARIEIEDFLNENQSLDVENAYQTSYGAIQ